MKKLQGQYCDSIKIKFDSILSNNHGYKMICKIFEITSGEEKNVYFSRLLIFYLFYMCLLCDRCRADTKYRTVCRSYWGGPR